MGASPAVSGFAQERHHLLGTKRPAQLSAGIDPTQHRNTQAVGFEPGFIVSDIHQLHQQTTLDKLHQHGFGDFTKMATNGAEQLTFRRHDDKTKRSKRSF